MGIRTFTFNGTSSADLGVLINENATFNAPERAGEMISIPGRNGAFWLDQGRFENIEVTYHCAIGEGSKSDFVEAMSDLREWLCSPIGYCRLEDDYNPNEFRMAVYKSGLEADEPFVTGAEFDIVFDCKPQRFLKSGETPITVTSGNTITNPTLFDAKPLLEVEGYGNISFNGYNIDLFDDLVGTVIVERYANKYLPYSNYIGDIYVNANDPISLDTLYINYSFTRANTNFTITSCVDSNIQYGGLGSAPLVSIVNNGETVAFGIQFGTVGYSALTAKEAWVSLTLTTTDSDGVSFVNNIRASIYYNGTDSISYTLTGLNVPAQYYISNNPSVSYSLLEIQSTATTYGHPTYIDCDFGEAYAIKSNFPLSLGRYVDLGSELPTLASGANTITYDNTITSLKVTPRWWTV